MVDRRRSESSRGEEPAGGTDASDTESLLERIRTLRLWADHLESLLAKRTEQAAVWRERAEQRKARVEALEEALKKPWPFRVLRHVRARPSQALKPKPALAPSRPTEAVSADLPTRIIHPTVRLAVLTEPTTGLPSLLQRMNTTELREESDADGLRSADVLVMLGVESQSKANEWELIREWVSQGQPTIAVDGGLDGVASLALDDLDYFDESDDIFRLDPSDEFGPDLDRDLHPTLLRLRERHQLLKDLGLPDDSHDMAERVAVARLRARRVDRSPHAVGGRLIRASGLTPPAGEPEALAVITSRRGDFVVDAVEQLVAQTYRPLRIGVALHGDAASAEHAVRQLLDSADVPHQILIRNASRPQGACLNDLVASMPGDVVLKIDDDDLYSPAYVEDMVSSLEYSRASVIGKASAFYRLRDGRRVLMRGGYYGPADHVVGSTITVKRQVWDEIRFPHRHERVDSKFLQGVKAVGFEIISQHPWDFCVVRHDRNTWGATDDYFAASGRPVAFDWSAMDTSVSSR